MAHAPRPAASVKIVWVLGALRIPWMRANADAISADSGRTARMGCCRRLPGETWTHTYTVPLGWGLGLLRVGMPHGASQLSDGADGVDRRELYTRMRTFNATVYTVLKSRVPSRLRRPDS